jgi:hypothetical protein
MEKYSYVIEWAYNISIGTAIVPVIVAILRWKFLNFPLKIVTSNVVKVFIISWIAFYFSNIEHSQRLLYHISPCLDIILISLITVTILDFRKEIQWVLAFLCVIFIGLMINDYITSKTLLNSYLSTAETIFVSILLILMLRKVALTYKSSTYKRSLIWIISALLIMNLFSILISTLMEKMSAYSTDFMQLCWYLSSPLFIVITNLMVAYGFYIIRNKVKEA